MKLDLADGLPDHFDQIEFTGLESVEILIPTPSVGSTNSYLDICGDLLDASWALEKLSAYCAKVVAEEMPRHIAATFFAPALGFADALIDVEILLNDLDEIENEARAGRLQTLRSEVWDYEDGIVNHPARVPWVIDAYFANMVRGAYYELQSEYPEEYREQVEKYPERRLGFHRSAYTHQLGGSCFVSADSWLLATQIDPDAFFEATEQEYRVKDFLVANVVTVDSHPVVVADGLVVAFPTGAYFRSRMCGGLVMRDEDDLPRIDLFADEGPHVTPYGRIEREEMPPFGNVCRVHETGTIVIVETTAHRHVLYDTSPMNEIAIRALLEKSSDLTENLSARIGLAKDLRCDWQALSDEDFEEVCYDLIYANPKFDHDSIRKLGHSRSRDGGRDIEVWEVQSRPGIKPRKWIFQCKLVKRRGSLGRTKLTDIGDMLDQYGAQGFGVMTSALIDAGLYDKLTAICGSRNVQQIHFSRLELERALARNTAIRKRYFAK